jgi:hypothetical protein
VLWLASSAAHRFHIAAANVTPHFISGEREMSAQILHVPVRKHEEHRAATRDAGPPIPEWAMTRARNGARWLDAKYGPDWDRRIDFDRLEIGSPIRCIVGQLIRHGYLSMLFATQIVAHGFSRGLLDVVVILLPIGPVKRAYRPLTDAWKVVLRERRGPAQAHVKPAALVAPRDGGRRADEYVQAA